MKPFAHLWPGVPLALGSAGLFGATAPVSKSLLGIVEPQMLAGILYLGAGAGLAIVHYVRSVFAAPAPEAPLRRADVPWLAAIVVFGGMLGPALLMLGLSLTDAASGSLLLNLESLATMAIAWGVYRENVDIRLLTGALAILTGAVVLAWNGQGVAINSGALLIAAACIAWGIDNNLTRRLSSSDPVRIAMIKGLAAGAANVAISLVRAAAPPDAAIILTAAVLGFLGIGVSLVLFVLALRHLGAARTGAYFSLAPFIGAILAILILNEAMTPQLAIAGVLMGVGFWLHLTERHQHEHEHASVEHEHSHVHDEHHAHSHEGPMTEPHSHPHRHAPLRHAHIHYPDLHHRHNHAHDPGDHR